VDDQTVLAWGQPQASLVVRQGAQVGTTFSIVMPEAVLGRDETAEISVRDPEVSRRHARVIWQSGSYYVEDLGSTNGTFLNGDLVVSPQALQPGDTIGIGQTLLVFQMQVGAVPPQATGISQAPAMPPPVAEPAPQKRSRCLLWGCGCVILLGLLLVVLAVVAMVLFAEDIQPIFDELGIPVQLTMRYVTHWLA
jgi:hypothetical protein